MLHVAYKLRIQHLVKCPQMYDVIPPVNLKMLRYNAFVLMQYFKSAASIKADQINTNIVIINGANYAHFLSSRLLFSAYPAPL